jgi:hypothetical protein
LPLNWLRAKSRPEADTGKRSVAPGDRGGPTCSTCGRPIDAHDRHVRFALPDVLVKPPRDWRRKIGGTESLIEVRDVAGFVRVLLPVSLSDDARLTIGTWLRVEPSVLKVIRSVFEREEYIDLAFDGELANGIYPWGPELLGAAAHATVKNKNEIPYLSSSTDALLQRVLTDEWPHEEVFAAFASAL